ncbi:hypothetical protein DESC_880117 [Desulfosarcina cetonica]|nr:hypothetical protein DESC_880117 [Desulfosarcina cetonica]
MCDLIEEPAAFFLPGGLFLARLLPDLDCLLHRLFDRFFHGLRFPQARHRHGGKRQYDDQRYDPMHDFFPPPSIFSRLPGDPCQFDDGRVESRHRTLELIEGFGNADAAAAAQLANIHMGVIELVEIVARDDLTGSPVGDNSPFFEHDHPIGNPQGMVREMGGLDKRVPIPGQVGDAPQKTDLVAVIQPVDRLVHDKDVGPLDQGAGDQNQLTFAAADRRVGPLAEMPDGQSLQGLVGGCVVLFVVAEEKRLVGHAPHEHHIQDPVPEGQAMHLGHIGDAPGQQFGGNIRDRAAFQADGAVLGRVDAQKQLQQGGLSAAVGSQEGNHFSRCKSKRNVAKDRMVVVAIGEVMDGDQGHGIYFHLKADVYARINLKGRLGEVVVIFVKDVVQAGVKTQVGGKRLGHVKIHPVIAVEPVSLTVLAGSHVKIMQPGFQFECGDIPF